MISTKKELSKLYNDSFELYFKYEEEDPSEEGYDDKLKDLLNKFLRIDASVQQMKLFSSNEELEDINTEDIKYITTPYFIGNTLLKIKGKFRIKQIKNSINYFETFIESCKNMKIIEKGDMEYFEKMNGKKKNMSEERTEKIERFKNKKKIVDQVNAIKKKMKDNDDENLMEELEREYYTLLTNQFIKETIENLKFIKEEKDLLEYAEKNITEEQMHDMRQKKNQKSNDPNDKIFQIPIDTNVKQKIMSEVFMNRNPYTVSLEEFAEEEMKKLRIQGEKEKQQQFIESQKIQPSDPDAETDEEILKKREWDDWKDWHPKGMGNMKK
eukprot:gene7515-11839_t